MATTRTDQHRPGAIVPAEYTPILFYALSTTCDGWPVPPLNINCEIEHRDAAGKNGAHAPGGGCCMVALRASGVRFAEHGGTGKCTVCGAGFIEGEVWRHEPTGEHINVGHICAAKYELYADWTAAEVARERQREGARRAALGGKKARARAAFLEAHPGLAQALEANHRIIVDIKERFMQYAELSDKQVALVLKLAAEALTPRPEEARAEAPTGKQTFRGRVVSVKTQVSDIYGTQIKMTVRVEAAGGNWMAWGTAPQGLLDATVNHHGALRGAKGGPGTEVEISATLQAGRERGFAIMKRPRGKVITLACGPDCGWCREQAGDRK